MAAVWLWRRELVLGLLATLVVFAVALRLRYQHLRGAGETSRRALRCSLAEVGAVVGTLPWLVMTMWPDPVAERRLSLVPIRDLLSLDPAAVPVQIGGNLMVLAALGFWLPVRFPEFAAPARILLVAVAASTAIEALQYALDLGRVSAVDDVLLNTLGAVLAALVSRPWWAVPAVIGAVEPG
jgi:hypothetical protein